MSEPDGKTTLLDWWLRYLKLGWPVFPLVPRGKIPLLSREEGGRGCLDASLNESQVRAWHERCPTANIGLATGHRFFVLDMDIKKGGEDSLAYLINQHGALPNTIQQITGTGGKHILFSLPDFPVHNSEGKIAEGLDIRGKGGYIVGAPSIHPDTGRRYFWDGLELIEQQQILPAPAWLLDWLKRDGEKQHEHPRAVPLPDRITEGGRNARLFKIAASLRRRGFGADEILATLRATNEQRCSPPLPLGELDTIAHSAARYAPEQKADLFAGSAIQPAEPAAPEVPVNPADVEAAIDQVIAKEDLEGAFRLAPEVARLRPQFRAVIKVKLKIGFGKRLTESLLREFDRAVADAAGDGTGQNPSEPPAGGDGETRPRFDGPDLTVQPLTDGGNGERMALLYGSEIKYCTEMAKWLRWDGKRWAIDERNIMRQLAKHMARKVYSQAALLETERPDLAKALAAWARKSESSRGITCALLEAATVPGIPISALALDQHPFLLNCRNGIVDLRTGKKLPHNDDAKDFLITKLCPTEYEPEAQCAGFQRFIEWAMGAESDSDACELSETTVRLVGFLQRAMGYGLTADVSEKCVFVFYGQGGNNGKTTLLTLFRNLLGRDYANLLLIDTIMAAKQTDTTARADMADLRGARFVQTSEVGREDKLNEQRVKYLTQGMGWIKSRRLYENPLEFEATHKLYMDCNFRPGVKHGDDAIWRRLKLVPFEVTIEDAKIDVHLADRLHMEARGVLAWAVRGAMLWHKHGLGEPPEVTSAVTEWRDHDDPLLEFLEDCCDEDQALFVPVPDLRNAYLWWARRNGEKFPLGRQQFNERLSAKKFRQDRKRESGEQFRAWYGLELKSSVLQSMRHVPESQEAFED